VKIDEKTGEITALKAGKVTITVVSTENTKLKGQVEITVIQPVNDITLNASTTELGLNQSLQLSANIQPSDASNKTLTWTSSNERVLTVDANGKVTGVGEGSATITATSTDGSKVSATIVLNVTKVGVTALSVKPAAISVNVNAIFDSGSYTILPSNAADQSVIITVENEEVAEVVSSVAGKFIVTGIAVGTTNVIISSVDNPSVSATFTVTVTANNTKLKNLYNNSGMTVFTKISNKEIVIGMAAGNVSPNTYKEFTSAMTEAQKVLANNSATQEEIDASYKRLKAAIEAMGVTVEEPEDAIEETTAPVLSVYPVPFSNELNVESEGLEAVEMLDACGKVIFRSSANESLNIETANYNNGVYFIKATVNGNVMTTTVLKK